MLSELRVRDLGVITDLTLQLAPGMTALTGETGAGKTLLVEALTLVLGGRAAPGLVRAGAAEALVEARFQDVAGVPDGEVVLARSVPASGRSRAWIDGRMATVAALGQAAAGLVDIHGQHDQQSLLAPAAQRQVLDAYAGADPGPLRRARARVAELERRLGELGGDAASREQAADLLRYQLQEIQAAGLSDPDEDARLAAEVERLGDLEAYRQAALEAAQLLDGGGAGGGTSGGSGDPEPAGSLMGRAAVLLAGHSGFRSWHERLRGALAEVEDVARELRRSVEGADHDPESLARSQERRRALGELRRKYGETLAQVMAFGEEVQARLAELEGAATEAGRLQEEHRAALAEQAAAAEVLGRARREAAPALALAAGERLRELAMPGARFEVEVGGTAAGERVVLRLGANPGEPVQPLSQVASGGELARAMLALRLVTSGGPPTMVFDEVDAGVGGSAALALAGALAEVAEGHQVLVVTHLAQVAAFADHQVAVHKEVLEGRTLTRVAELGREQRVVELSRMLSGHPDSQTARAHAGELLGRAGELMARARTARASTTGAPRVD